MMSRTDEEAHVLQSIALFLLMATPAATAKPAEFVDAWHAALRGSDREVVLGLMLPEVVVFESGGAEKTRDEYASHHLDADMAFARATATKVESRRVVELGPDAALVLSHTSTTGTFQGKPADSRGVETMVLRRANNEWRVAHIHWSAARRPPAGAATAGAAPAAGAQDVTADRLFAALQEAGLKPERREPVTQPFFEVPAKVLVVGEDEMQVFEFPAARAAQLAAATVEPSGQSIGTTSMRWIAPPWRARGDNRGTRKAMQI
jgi:uncharacterized protein (TIGR02246 family)